jgi:hypothetical protein
LKSFEALPPTKGSTSLLSPVHLILVYSGYWNIKACLCFIAMWKMMVVGCKHCVHYAMDLLKLK